MIINETTVPPDYVQRLVGTHGEGERNERRPDEVLQPRTKQLTPEQICKGKRGDYYIPQNMSLLSW